MKQSAVEVASPDGGAVEDGADEAGAEDPHHHERPQGVREREPGVGAGHAVADEADGDDEEAHGRTHPEDFGVKGLRTL